MVLRKPTDADVSPWNRTCRRTTIVLAMTILPELSLPIADPWRTGGCFILRSTQCQEPLTRPSARPRKRGSPRSQGERARNTLLHAVPFGGPGAAQRQMRGPRGELVMPGVHRCTDARTFRKNCHPVPLFKTPGVAWLRSCLFSILFSDRKIRRNDRTGGSSKAVVATNATICHSEIGLMFTMTTGSPVIGSLGPYVGT
jgi:hypothetical protein